MKSNKRNATKTQNIQFSQVKISDLILRDKLMKPWIYLIGND